MTTLANTREETIDSTKGIRIFVRSWLPESAPRAVVVICHGLNSHSGQYRWAERATLRERTRGLCARPSRSRQVGGGAVHRRGRAGLGQRCRRHSEACQIAPYRAARIPAGSQRWRRDVGHVRRSTTSPSWPGSSVKTSPSRCPRPALR